MEDPSVQQMEEQARKDNNKKVFKHEAHKSNANH